MEREPTGVRSAGPRPAARSARAAGSHELCRAHGVRPARPTTRIGRDDADRLRRARFGHLEREWGTADTAFREARTTARLPRLPLRTSSRGVHARRALTHPWPAAGNRHDRRPRRQARTHSGGQLRPTRCRWSSPASSRPAQSTSPSRRRSSTGDRRRARTGPCRRRACRRSPTAGARPRGTAPVGRSRAAARPAEQDEVVPAVPDLPVLRQVGQPRSGALPPGGERIVSGDRAPAPGAGQSAPGVLRDTTRGSATTRTRPSDPLSERRNAPVPAVADGEPEDLAPAASGTR
jgi:hypothetical protein